MIAEVLSFAVVAGLLTIIPGLDTALVVRAALTQGRRPAFATALGINTGALVWGAGAAAGTSALLTASHIAATVLRCAGAAYMIGYGAAVLWRSRSNRHDTASGIGSQPVTVVGGGLLRAWARGVATNLLNPKVGAFYVAMMPQFMPEGVPPLSMGLLLAFVHDLEGVAWFTLLICGTHLARGWLGKPVVHRLTDRVAGAVLVGFGLKLALSTR